MSKNQRLGIGLALVATASIALMLTVKSKKAKKRKRQEHEVSEEGYETAHDVLFPLKIQRMKKQDII